METQEFIRKEIDFLIEEDIETNKHGIYLFTSTNESQTINLPYFLNAYKIWLEEKGFIKILK